MNPDRRPSQQTKASFRSGKMSDQVWEQELLSSMGFLTPLSLTTAPVQGSCRIRPIRSYLVGIGSGLFINAFRTIHLAAVLRALRDFVVNPDHSSHFRADIGPIRSIGPISRVLPTMAFLFYGHSLFE